MDKSRFHIGDRVWVGAQCDRCGEWYCCEHKHDPCCKNGFGTHGSIAPDGQHTQAGYANYTRVNSHFAYRIPDALDSISAAPLMCGEMTGLLPLLKAGVTKGTKVGVVSIRGIGHMTILFAKVLRWRPLLEPTRRRRLPRSRVSIITFLPQRGPWRVSGFAWCHC